MKTTFDEATRAELIGRIGKLNESSVPLWGKMNVFQVVKHCCVFEEMIAGERKYKQVFMGRLFGKMALREMIGNDKPMRKNAPTVKDFIVTGDKFDLITAKRDWISMLNNHANLNNDSFVHPFFGKMTREQVGQLAYKHYDHHLRQFNV